MIGGVLITFSDVILCCVILVGNSIFLRFVSKTQNVTSRALNVLLILLSVVYIVFSVAILYKHVMYLFVWEYSIPSTLDGLINVHTFLVLINAKNIIFLMTSLATLVKHVSKDLYLQMSLRAKWSVILVIFALVLILLHAWLYGDCFGTDNILQCAKDNGIVFAISTVAITAVMVVGILVECVYQRRKKIKKWIMNKWNKYNNYVVEFAAEQEGEEPQQIQIYVVQLQDWNQVVTYYRNFYNKHSFKVTVNQQEVKEMVGTLTMAATFMITFAVYISHVLVNSEETVIVRGIINQVVMAATIIIWNINNKELCKFTKMCFIKEE